MADDSAPELEESLSPSAKIPSWRVALRPVIAVSLAAMALQAALAFSTPQPTAVPLVAPGAIALVALRTRKLSWGIITTAVITAAILAGVFWAALNAMHAARWSTVADALCPLAAVGVAWVLERTVPPKPTT
jgi:hypothetical protein